MVASFVHASAHRVTSRSDLRDGPSSGVRLALHVIFAWALAAGIQIFTSAGHRTALTRGPDDALRLVQWRLFESGAGWYDLTIARLAPPEGGLHSHWSRLIDAGLALLHGAFRPIVGDPLAETLVQIVWPLLMLLVAMTGVVLLARRLGGVNAALATTLLAALSLPMQFQPGRIDHHNAQIALTILAWAAVFHARRSSFAAVVGGMLVTMTLAIGLEAAPFVVAASVALVLAWIFDPDSGENHARALVWHAAGLAGGALFFLLLALPPARWAQTACDAFAANFALPIAAGASVLMASVTLARKSAHGIGTRVMLLAPALMVSAGLFVWMDPACLRGPFANLDPAARLMWLDHIVEVQPALGGKKGYTVLYILTVAWPVLAVLAWFVLSRKLRRTPSVQELTLAGMALLSAFGGGFYAIRLLVYGQWLALPLAGVAVTMLWQMWHLRRPLSRAAPAFMASPIAMLLAITSIVPDSTKPVKDAGLSCRTLAAMHPLAQLPPGLVATDTLLGSHVLALTPHSVLSAPYHRIDAAILANGRMLTARPETARKMAFRLGVDYIVTCPYSLVLDDKGKRSKPGSLWNDLLAGHVPAWLEPVALSGKTPLRVFRVRRPQQGEGQVPDHTPAQITAPALRGTGVE